MRFNDNANLNSGRVRDGGGSGGLGRGGFSLPGGRLGGGGLVGIIIAVVVFFVASRGGGGGLGSVLSGSVFGSSSVGLSGQQFDYSTCRTGADANRSTECALVAVENSLTDYWSKQPQVAQVFHPEAGIDVFHGSVSTGGCGSATTDVGPFYCPVDETIYLDTAFYDTVFQQLGGKDSPFVRAYVIAHEYGHHVQNLLGTMSRVKTQQGADSDAVRLELQADCYAGMWTQNATNVPDQDGNSLIQDLTQSDITQGIAAVQTVGDDSVEKAGGGSVTPDQWTHGSSAERVEWFEAGLNGNGDIATCDTFSATDLTNPATA